MHAAPSQIQINRRIGIVVNETRCSLIWFPALGLISPIASHPLALPVSIMATSYPQKPFPRFRRRKKMEDELSNNWGTNLVYTCGGGKKMLRSFESDIASAIPGYYLQSLKESGTAANIEAVKLATDNNPSSCI